MEAYDYNEGGRLAYDCYCASHKNMEPAQEQQPQQRPVASTERDMRGKLNVRKPDDDEQKKPATTAMTSWDDLSPTDKKRWVDIAITVVTHFSTSGIPIIK